MYVNRAWLAVFMPVLLAACSPGSPSGTSGAPSDNPSGTVSSAPSSSVTPAQRGEQIYSGNCVPCHQPDGHGVPHVYPALAGSALVNGEVAPLAHWVLKGERSAAIPKGRYTTRMPQYGWLNDADAAALLTHLRSHFGNTAGAVQAADIARAMGR